jgi:hypothetical protein
MPPASTLKQIEDSRNQGSARDERISSTVERPSNQYRNYDGQDIFSVSIPQNWLILENHSSVTFAPQGAYGNYQGASVFTHGAMIGITNVDSVWLQEASDAYLSGLLRANDYLKAERNYHRTSLDGRNALLRKLTGVSPVTGITEVVNVYTVFRDNNNLFYMILVAPERDYRRYTNAFREMTRSLAIFN